MIPFVRYNGKKDEKNVQNVEYKKKKEKNTFCLRY